MAAFESVLGSTCQAEYTELHRQQLFRIRNAAYAFESLEMALERPILITVPILRPFLEIDEYLFANHCNTGGVEMTFARQCCAHGARQYSGVDAGGVKLVEQGVRIEDCAPSATSNVCSSEICLALP